MKVNTTLLIDLTNELQLGVDLFQANIAACVVFLGKIDEPQKIYTALLKRFPNHQRNHYQLARRGKGKNSVHIEQMHEILKNSEASSDRNIFMYYALGKELVDLERWQESYSCHKKGGDAVSSLAKYEIASDIALIDKIIQICYADWLSDGAGKAKERLIKSHLS